MFPVRLRQPNHILVSRLLIEDHPNSTRFPRQFLNLPRQFLRLTLQCRQFRLQALKVPAHRVIEELRRPLCEPVQFVRRFLVVPGPSA